MDVVVAFFGQLTRSSRRLSSQVMHALENMLSRTSRVCTRKWSVFTTAAQLRPGKVGVDRACLLPRFIVMFVISIDVAVCGLVRARHRRKPVHLLALGRRFGRDTHTPFDHRPDVTL